MKTSESIVHISKALLEFRSGAFAKDAVNPHFKSRYANLDSLLDAVAAPLRAVGLVLIQSPSTVDSGEGALPGLSSRLQPRCSPLLTAPANHRRSCSSFTR